MLAIELDGTGHEVVVVDQDPDSFRRLGANFGGSTVTGVGFDWDTLLEAGVERADSVIPSEPDVDSVERAVLGS